MAKSDTWLDKLFLLFVGKMAQFMAHMVEVYILHMLAQLLQMNVLIII